MLQKTEGGCGRHQHLDVECCPLGSLSALAISSEAVPAILAEGSPGSSQKRRDTRGVCSASSLSLSSAALKITHTQDLVSISGRDFCVTRAQGLI